MICDHQPLLGLPSNGVFLSYWVNMFDGFKALIEYFSKLLNLDVYCANIHSGSLWMLPYIQSRQKSKYNVIVQACRGTILSDEEYRSLLLDDNNIGAIQLNDDPWEFRIRNFHSSIDYFLMPKGSWITMDNLITQNFVELYNYEKQFTNTEVNRFLRHWIAGGAQRLKMTSIKVSLFLPMLMFEGISRSFKRERLMDGSYKGVHGAHVFTQKSLTLRSEDGRRASFEYSQEQERFRRLAGYQWEPWRMLLMSLFVILFE